MFFALSNNLFKSISVCFVFSPFFINSITLPLRALKLSPNRIFSVFLFSIRPGFSCCASDDLFIASFNIKKLKFEFSLSYIQKISSLKVLTCSSSVVTNLVIA